MRWWVLERVMCFECSACSLVRSCHFSWMSCFQTVVLQVKIFFQIVYIMFCNAKITSQNTSDAHPSNPWSQKNPSRYGKLGPTNFGLDFRYPLSVSVETSLRDPLRVSSVGSCGVPTAFRTFSQHLFFGEKVCDPSHVTAIQTHSFW